MTKINSDILSQSSQASVGCIKEFVLFHIILRIQPFFLELSPNGFRNVQMRGVWWQESNEQSPLLPERHPFPDATGFMDACIIQYQYGFLFDVERESLQIFDDRVGSNIAWCHQTHILALSVYKAQNVDFISFFNRNMDILSWKLPAVRHISLRTDMRFISIIEVYFSRLFEMLKFCNYRYLMVVMLLVRLTFRAGSYPFIFSTNTFKKRRRVLSLMDFPREASHSAFAVCMRCRWFLTDSSKLFLSSESSIGLRPCPGLLRRPDMPSDLKRETQWLTLTWLMPVIEPTSLDERPSAFNRMTWQRLRKQWLSPFFKLCSKLKRSFADSVGVLTRPMGAKVQNNAKQF